MSEPTIITVLKLDHGRGEHDGRPNEHCPTCGEAGWLNDGWRLSSMTTPSANPAPSSTEPPTETEPTRTPTIPEESATRTASVLSSEMRAVGAYKNGEARAMRRQA